MSSDEIQNLLKSGIQAYKNGNKVIARSIFEQVTRQEPENELAWMWLASVLETPAERRDALRRVVAINPGNEKAQQALAKLEASGRPSRPPAPSEPPLRPSEPPIAAAAAPTYTETTRDFPPARAPEPSEPLREQALPLEDEPQPAPRRSSSGGMSTPMFILIAVIAFGFIGAGLFLLFQQTQEEDPTPAPVVNQPPTVAATITPPPATVVIVTAVTGNFSRGELGATWTPSPTNTPVPTATATLPPFNLSIQTIIYNAPDNPAGLNRLRTVLADGEEGSLFEVILNTGNIEIIQPVTQTPGGGGDEGGSDSILPTPTFTPTPEGEVTPEASPTPTEASIEPAFTDFEYLEPSYSPDGGQVAFTVQIAEDVQEIFLLALPGGTPRQLTTLGGAVTGGVSWSPDGQQVAFHSNADGDFEVYLVSVEGGTPTNLTNNEAQDRDPVYSPADGRIVFASDRNTPGELEIWAAPPRGGGDFAQLTDATSASFSPAFSPDGTQIAFISNRNGDNDLFLMQADGTDERLISLSDGQANEYDPAWSPDGDWIAVSSSRESTRILQIWIVKPDGSEWRRVTQGQGDSRNPNWQPQDE